MRGLEIIFWVTFVCLMVPAGLLSVVRLVEPESGRALQIQAFTPYALPLYALALLLLVGAAVRASNGRAHLLAPTVLALLGLGAHFYWFSPQVLGSTPSPAAGATSIRVMTANLYAGEGDAVALAQEVKDREVDLLVVNEITDRALRDMQRVGLRSELHFQAGSTGSSVEGTMIFSRAPIEPVEPVDTEFDSLVATTGGFVVLAVHPNPPVQPDQWRTDHDTLYAAVKSSKPDLILGDFNATADHAPMRRLADRGYRDSVEITNGILQPTWPANGQYPILGWFPPSVAIDHVLVASDIAVVDTQTVDLPASDHRPVVAVIARR